MENRGRGRLSGVAVLAALAAIAVTGSASGRAARRRARRRRPPTRSRTTATSRSTCGRRTTRIPGPQPVIKALAASFTKKYPNVKVKLKFYSFTNYIKIIKLSLNSGNAPDVAEGNQGFQIDSALVKAKLIKPLDSYATKYGWDKEFSAGTAQQFRWTPDGKTFGKGNLWGVAQFGQSTGVFYNKALLKKYGGDPDNMPEDVRRLRASCWPSCTPNAPVGRADHQARQQGRLRGAARLRHGAGRVRLGPVHPQLDLPRPGQHVRVARPTSRR